MVQPYAYSLDALFSVKQFLGKNLLLNLIFMCTEVEARNYGIFLSEILSTVTAWHKDKALYEKEANIQSLNYVLFRIAHFSRLLLIL